MTSIKHALFMIAGMTFLTPCVHAQNKDLNSMSIDALRDRANHDDKEADKIYKKKLNEKYKNKTVSELMEMANQGDSEASYLVGSTYLLKLYQPQNAIEWFNKSSKDGNVNALFAISNIYYYGWGVPKDIQKVIELCKEAANRGLPDGALRLVEIYTSEKYGLQDYVEANHWLKIAVQEGASQALDTLGLSYENGIGTLPDKEKAKYYYKQACSKQVQAGCEDYDRLNKS